MAYGKKVLCEELFSLSGGDSMRKIFKYVWMYMSCLFPRDRHLCVFGAWLGERFTDNSMQLFKEASKEKRLTCIWITKDQKICREIRASGLKCLMWGTKKARKAQQRAGYAIVSNGISDLEHTYLGGAVILDLWHGVPLKKIGFDDDMTVNYDSTFQKIKRFFKYLPYRKMYYFAPSENFRKIYSSAFRQPESHIVVLGQPRNDVFFEKQHDSGRELYFPGKRIILYCPTHRLEGKKKIEISKIFDLPALEDFLEKKNYYFVIKKHFYHRDETENLDRYKRIVDITGGEYDIQKLIQECCLLVTDYSSIYIDYLLLDKPLLFYCYDYDDYIKNDRGMYFDYDQVTPGEKAHTFPEFAAELNTFARNPENYGKGSRERLKNFFYCRRGQKNTGSVIIRMILENRF